MERILVTGSNGTIGTLLCEKLVELGYTVVGADRAENRWDPDVGKLTVPVNLLDKDETIKKLPGDIDLVVHLAANAGVRDLVGKPHLAMENLETLHNVLEFAGTNNIKKFIFASSREVYGNREEPCDEKCADLKKCENLYAASKMAGEAMVRAYGKRYGLGFVIMRLSNVYGMYDDRGRVIPTFIKNSLAGKDLYVFGKGKELDLIHIDDAVEGILLGIRKFNRAQGRTFNIAYGRGTPVSEVAKLVKLYTNSSSRVIIRGNRAGEVMRCVPSIKLAKEVLGFSPSISATEGLKRSVDWYLKNIM